MSEAIEIETDGEINRIKTQSEGKHKSGKISKFCNPTNRSYSTCTSKVIVQTSRSKPSGEYQGDAQSIINGEKTIGD